MSLSDTVETMVRKAGSVLVAVAATAAGFAPATEAAVRVDSERIVVSDREGSVVVDRSPFRLSVRDRSGRTVLRSGGRAPARAVRLPETRDPEPLALELEKDNAVYAPLTFEVGRERRAQWNGSFFPGNMLFARRSGTVHTARTVRAVRKTGEGVRLVLSTTDRTRSLILRIAPDATAGLRITAEPTKTAGVMAMASSFGTARGEGFHGFGGRHWGTNQRGRKLYGWVEQENVGGNTLNATAALPAVIEDGTDFTADQLGLPKDLGPSKLPGGAAHYLVPGGPNAAYYVQNQFISSRGYGFLLHQSELSRWRMGNDRSDAWQVHVSAPSLSFTVVPGSVAQAVGGVTAQTGRHRLPPAWSQGAVL